LERELRERSSGRAQLAIGFQSKTMAMKEFMKVSCFLGLISIAFAHHITVSEGKLELITLSEEPCEIERPGPLRVNETQYHLDWYGHDEFIRVSNVD